ncbi:MAG: 5'/3'-nucleotidase SurE [PVC group bacterium]|nr:5'/3'-nucleotidase SurE [PVC group bacterium]
MKILLTNDDGIYAEGLYALYKKLSKNFDVTVCAPEVEQSAIGHAITMRRPLRVQKANGNAKLSGYAVNGTPADCVKIAVRTLLKKKPDLVISGINHGPNLGADVLYSGTVSAAAEGAILGIPSIAVSLATYQNHDFRGASEIMLKLAKLVQKTGLPNGMLLNVNVPAVPMSKIRGILATKQGRSLYQENFVKRTDPRGRMYYWLTGKVKWLKKPKDSDIKAIEEKYVSVTPLQFDLTAYDFMPKLKEILGK